jgi:hypothetical protein
MSCFTADEFVEFLFSYLPPWFGDENPFLEAILTGFGTVSSFIYCNLVFIKNQTRIQTSTGDFLDISKQDYFNGLARNRCPNETDDNFRQYILNTLIAPRLTIQAIIDRLFDLTGRTPIVTTGFGNNSSFYDVSFLDENAYGMTDGLLEVWITAFRPLVPLQNTTAFLDETAYADDGSYYGGQDDSGLCVTDEMILITVNITIAAGVTAHVTISD